MVSSSMNAPDGLVEAAPGFVSRSLVPCFNEEAGIAELVRRCREAAVAAVGANYEIILVDDGSIDRTWPAILGELNGSKNLIGIRLSRNLGIRWR